MNYLEKVLRSPNTDGKTIDPLGVVIHHSCGSYGSTVNTCMDRKEGVSYNVVCNLDGERTQVLPLNVKAWHAGVSKWRGKQFCNSFTVGFAWSGDTNERLLTADEVKSFVEWFLINSKTYGWGLVDVVTHRAIAMPLGRKDDVDVRAEKTILEALKAAGVK